MKEILLRILNEYQQEKSESFRNNSLAAYIRRMGPETIRNEVALTAEYGIKGSPGQGSWAEIPWICIFDSRITTRSPSVKGYHIAYLFRSDMSGVYISLNMGFKQFVDWAYIEFEHLSESQLLQKAREHMQKTALLCRELIRPSLTDFSDTVIDLTAKEVRGKGYELGHICGKFYSKVDMPADNILVDDLRKFLHVYKELTGILSGREIIDLVLE